MKLDDQDAQIRGVVWLIVFVFILAGISATVKACAYGWDWNCVIAECRKMKP